MTAIFVELLAGINAGWRVFFLSAIPVAELRVAIPLGLAWGLTPLNNFLYAISGNMLPVVPLLLLLKPILNCLSKISFLKFVIDKIVARTRKHSTRIEKFGALGLALFVGIPAPGTGAWTGVLLAYLFNIRFWMAFPAILAGVLLAGIIVTFASLGIWELAKNGIGYLAAAAIAVIILIIWFRKRHHK